MFYTLFRGILRVFTFCVCRVRVHGLERLPREGPLLIVANHLSWYDPLLFGVVLPRRIWFYTKSDMFQWPVVGGLCRLTGQIAVRRGEGDRAALEEALRYLREGRALSIFPEGTVERQERMIPAYTGVAMLALRSGATVLPIAHSGTRRILRKGRGWRPRVEIWLGEPYTPVVPSGMARKAALRELTSEVMERIAEMLPEEVRGVYGGEQVGRER